MTRSPIELLWTAKNRHETGIFPVLQNLTHICVFSQFKLNTLHAVPVPGAIPDLKEIDLKINASNRLR